MARGNWQRRVERTENRRAAEKQRKQKIHDRASFKLMVSSLLTALDKHRVAASTAGNTLHVWTDVAPSGYSLPILDLYAEEDDGRKKQRRGRSGSFNETPSKASRKPSDGGSKKKAHPRSREAVIDPEEEEGAAFAAPRLCRNQFYQGECLDMMKTKKSAGCRHVHYVKKKQTTLSEVLGIKKHEDVLSSAEEAMVGATVEDTEEISKGMEMLYHFPVKLITSDSEDGDGEEQFTVGRLLSQALSDKSCNNASLVYITIEDTLIFDRYQGGLVVPDTSQVFGSRARSSSVLSEASEVIDGADRRGAEVVPAPVLEHILTFLPDTAFATMSRVCRSWQSEIGTSSPDLWRYLLRRRNWPLPESSSPDRETNRDEMKEAFTMHYQIVRDMKAIKEALTPLVSPRRGLPDEVEMVYQLFSARRKAPAEPNACVAMEVWSSNKTIAAYSHDCTIRLFKALEKSAAEKGGKACRELISVCMDPFRKTKKHTARLVAMGLDDEWIGCLLHVHGGVRSENYNLSIISREAYLEAAGSDTADSLGWSELEEGTLNVIDIGEAVVNYILSADEVDHRMLRLIDLLNDGGEMEDVEVLVSESVVACGYGRFLVEVTISIPDVETNENEENGLYNAMLLLDRKLVIFSSTHCAIVWMGDSNPTRTAIPRNHDLILSGVTHGIGGSQLACSLVAVSSTSPTIILSEVDPTGQVHSMHAIEAAEIVRVEILTNEDEEGPEWVLETARCRPVALLEAEVVAVDVLSKDRGDDSRDYKSILSFYSRFPDQDESSYETFVLYHCNIISMEQIRDQHVVLICEEIGDDSDLNPTNRDGDAEIDAVDGQWFGEEPAERVVSLNAVIFHIPSRKIIHRIQRLLPNDTNMHEALLQGTTSLVVTSSIGATIGVGVWWKGVVMTGNDIRDLGRSDGIGGLEEPMTPRKGGNGGRTRKKKKGKPPNKGGKKDGFARGMSMRG